MLWSGTFKRLTVRFFLLSLCVTATRPCVAEEFQLGETLRVGFDRPIPFQRSSGVTFAYKVAQNVEVFTGLNYLQTSDRRSELGSFLSDVGVGVTLDRDTHITTSVGSAISADDPGSNDYFISAGVLQSF